MKPISTVPRALATIDMATGEEAVAIHQRSDVRRAAAGVVAEAMVALVVARAVLEKFGGDSLGETRRNIDGYLHAIAERAPVSDPMPVSGNCDGSESRAGRIAGLREIHHRTSARAGDGFDPARYGLCDRGEDRPGDRRDLRRGRRRGVPPDRRRGDPRGAGDPRRDSVARGRRRHVTGGPGGAGGDTVVFLEISASEGVRRTSGSTVRPLLAGADHAEKYRKLMNDRIPLYRRVATIRVNTNRRNPGAVVRHIVARLENPQPQRRRRQPWRRTSATVAKRIAAATKKAEPTPVEAAPASPAQPQHPSPATVAARRNGIRK